MLPLWICTWFLSGMLTKNCRCFRADCRRCFAIHLCGIATTLGGAADRLGGALNSRARSLEVRVEHPSGGSSATGWPGSRLSRIQGHLVSGINTRRLPRSRQLTAPFRVFLDDGIVTPVAARALLAFDAGTRKRRQAERAKPGESCFGSPIQRPNFTAPSIMVPMSSMIS